MLQNYPRHARATRSRRFSQNIAQGTLRKYGYNEVKHTPGLSKHETKPIWFTLTVDNFGVKYVGKKHAKHLMKVLKVYYKVEEDWTGNLYYGINLNWNYEKRYVDISVSTCVHKNLIEYNHIKPNHPQNCPYPPEPITYGRDSDKITPGEEYPLL
jgi:hypothetical protein